MEKITVRANINANKQKVWDYYTNPAHIVNWNFADQSWCCPVAHNDMRVGGTYFARMEAKDGSFGFDFEAVYTDVQEGARFTYVFGGREAIVTFEEKNEYTEVCVLFDPETENSIDLQAHGWQSILNNFKMYVEQH